ncbi:MAG TPA: DRTGG domain-containing protein [Bacillota bacterium]|nr:DRTGG domain-containing protein [Bacillota bacterium]
MSTKHEQIIRHILSLNVGEKISVRKIARELHVSDGTAYRAIKEAENQGIVSTIERVGTIRIEQKRKDNIERLTFAEVINIVDGQVLGGRDGLHKTLNKFVIGAMRIDAMMRYTEAGSLLIIGNRTNAHEIAIREGAAVLITGGFDTDDHIKQLANEKELPIMSTSYDSFTVASMINRAIYDQMIKKDIISVEDIFTPLEEVHFLYTEDTIDTWYSLNTDSTHTRFPVVNSSMRVRGIVTSQDIVGKPRSTHIEKIMTKSPLVVHEKTSLAYVAHMMVWEGIEVVPVVDESDRLLGVVSRQDVLKALQHMQRQPQVGETIDDIVSSNLTEAHGRGTTFKTKVIPQMTNALGTLSNGVLTSLITESSRRLLLIEKKCEIVVENITIYYIEPVQIDRKITIHPRLLEAGRMHATVDVDIYAEKKLVGKGLLSAQLINR